MAPWKREGKEVRGDVVNHDVVNHQDACGRTAALTKAVAGLESRVGAVRARNVLSVLVDTARRFPPVKRAPAELADRVARLVERQHRPGRHAGDGGPLFVLPSWIALGLEAPTGVQALRIHLRRAPAEFRLATDANWTSRRLRSVRLSPRRPASWRRILIAAAARAIQRSIEEVLGTPSRVGDDRATLALVASERREGSTTWVESYAVEEIERRRQISSCNRCNLDPALAAERWQIHVGHLPCRLRSMHPSEIVDRVVKTAWKPQENSKRRPPPGGTMER